MYISLQQLDYPLDASYILDSKYFLIQFTSFKKFNIFKRIYKSDEETNCIAFSYTSNLDLF